MDRFLSKNKQSSVAILNFVGLSFLAVACYGDFQFISPREMQELRLRQANACYKRDPRLTANALHRIAKDEYNFTILDVFGLSGNFSANFPADADHHGFWSSEVLEINEAFLDEAQNAAFAVSEALNISTSSSAHIQIPNANITQSNVSNYATPILNTYLSSLFRRPVTNAEISPYVELVRTVMSQPNSSFANGIRVAIEGALISPHFIFRVEAPLENSSGVQALTDYQLAARLAAFLWRSVPDATLKNAAQAGLLTQSEDELNVQINRMMNHAKFDRYLGYLTDKWLIYTKKTIAPDPNAYPNWQHSIYTNMIEETRLFLSELVKTNQPIGSLFTANFTYLNNTLANHYGLPSPNNANFVRYDLSVDDRREGFLQQGSYLVGHSTANDGDPTSRGMGILEKFTCNAPSPPPATLVQAFPPVPALSQNGLPLSTRERLAYHRDDPVCAACHVEMDPLGLSLQNFDSVGLWRANDFNNRHIDTTGTYIGDYFQDSTDMTDTIVSKSRYPSCTTAALFSSAGLAFDIKKNIDDRCSSSSIIDSLQGEETGFRDLIVGIIHSSEFKLNHIQ